MASSEVDVLTASPPPPYTAQMEEEAVCRIRVPPPLYSKEMVVGDVVQDERRRQDKETKLFVVSWLYS